MIKDPRVLITTNLFIGLLGLGLTIKNLFSAGIGWDAVYDTRASILTRSLPDEISLDQAYDSIPTISEFYGIFMQQAADLSASIFRATTTFLDPLSPQTYIWQGGINIVIAFFSSIIFGFAIYKVTQSLFLSTFGWALLNTLPIWVGMSHINYKDMPVAAGLTIVSSSLIILVKSKSNLQKYFLIPILISFGTFIAIATRPSSFVFILVIVLLSPLSWFFLKYDLKNILLNFLSLLLGFSLGVIGLRLTNPLAKINFSQWLFDSIVLTRQFPHNMPQRFAGQNYSSLELPFWYAPAWFIAQTPLLILFFILTSCLFILLNINNRIFKDFKKSLFNFFPFVIQGILFPAAIIFSNAVIYDAVRHLLFVWPSLIIFFIIITRVLLKNLQFKSNSKHFLILASLVLILIFNVFATARWSPYSYAFINPIAGYSAKERHWDLDFWGVSAKEGINRLNAKYDFKEIYVMPDGSSSAPFGGAGLSRLEDLNIQEPIGLYVFMRWNHRIVPEKCDILFEIKRDRQILGMGGVCPSTKTKTS